MKISSRSLKGVVAAITGNHGAAVANVAQLAKLPATHYLQCISRNVLFIVDTNWPQRLQKRSEASIAEVAAQLFNNYIIQVSTVRWSRHGTHSVSRKL
jgi:DNA-binding transcriptional regulator YbjK